MKSLRLLALALLACACTAAVALACDAHKSATKSASNSAGKVTGATPAQAGQAATTASVATAQKSAKHAGHEGCSAEMAAACQSNAAVASAMGCEAKGTSAAVASNGKAKSAKGGDCCAMKGSSAAVAANAKGATSATVAAKHAATDCSACHDWTTCESDVRAIGARSQVVALKNGAMIVYTTDAPTDVKALQAMVAKRHEKLLTVLAAGGSQKLCPDCRSLRGAIASGKLHREVVNVERGCMTLLTSNDQDIVRRIRNMTGQPVAMR